MKKIWLLMIIGLALWTSCDKQLDGYLISGNLRDTNREMVYLFRSIGNSLQAIDSTRISADGKFEFKGQLPHTEFLLLSVVSDDKKVTNNLQLLVGSNDLLLIDGSLATSLKENYSITGSRESMFVQELNLKLKAAAMELDTLAESYRQAISEGKMDSALKVEYDRKNREIMDRHRKFSEEFISKHDSSLVSVMALYQSYNSQEQVFHIAQDLELFKRVADKMDMFNNESELTRTLKLQILAFEDKGKKPEVPIGGLKVGDMAPEIMIANPEGTEIALSQFRGNYVLLDFWAAWCAPCRQENPNLVKNYKKYHGRGFVIFQLSLDKNKKDWLAAIKQDKLTWVHGCDFNFWDTPAARVYNISSIPSNFLIAPSGRIVAINLRGDELEKKLKEVYLK